MGSVECIAQVRQICTKSSGDWCIRTDRWRYEEVENTNTQRNQMAEGKKDVKPLELVTRPCKIPTVELHV
jgi:hypothetical protein